MADVNKLPTIQWRDNSMRFAIVVTLLLVTAITAGAVALFVFGGDSARRRESQADLDRQIADVRAGKTKTIRLYGALGTDNLLKQLKDVPSVEDLDLHLTDVSDEGMDSVAAMRGLRSLIIYGGYPGVDDAGLAKLKSPPHLETLKLVNTQVTNDSFPVFRDFPRLENLTLFHERWRNFTFTRLGLPELEKLTSLRTLEVSGGWLPPGDVKELQRALPNCVVTNKSSDDQKVKGHE